jgi:hypothetical protein
MVKHANRPKPAPAPPPQPHPAVVESRPETRTALTLLETRIIAAHAELSADGAKVWPAKLARHINVNESSIQAAWARLVKSGRLPAPASGHEIIRERVESQWKPDHAAWAEIRALKAIGGNLNPRTIRLRDELDSRAEAARLAWKPSLPPKEACDAMRREQRRVIRRRARALAEMGGDR